MVTVRGQERQREKRPALPLYAGMTGKPLANLGLIPLSTTKDETWVLEDKRIRYAYPREGSFIAVLAAMKILTRGPESESRLRFTGPKDVRGL